MFQSNGNTYYAVPNGMLIIYPCGTRDFIRDTWADETTDPPGYKSNLFLQQYFIPTYNENEKEKGGFIDNQKMLIKCNNKLKELIDELIHAIILNDALPDSDYRLEDDVVEKNEKWIEFCKLHNLQPFVEKEFIRIWELYVHHAKNPDEPNPFRPSAINTNAN